MKRRGRFGKWPVVLLTACSASGFASASTDKLKEGNSNPVTKLDDKISSQLFYANYIGHTIDDLSKIHEIVHVKNGKNVVWLAGDSSLDNKHWLYPCTFSEKQNSKLDDDTFTGNLTNGYEQIFHPKRGVKDVCFWLNENLQGSDFSAINCAVEESTLHDRNSVLLPQDDFIRDKITEKDILIVSVGGNDVALHPSIFTLLAIGTLNFLTPISSIHEGKGISVKYLSWLFKDQTTYFINSICEKKKPKKVIVCMIYYPCLKGKGWADSLLKFLGYTENNLGKKNGNLEEVSLKKSGNAAGNSEENPIKIHAIIDMIFEKMISKIKIEGVEVVPVPLSKILDFKNEKDYENRVEPSVQGGKKMADFFTKIILEKQ